MNKRWLISLILFLYVLVIVVISLTDARVQGSIFFTFLALVLFLSIPLATITILVVIKNHIRKKKNLKIALAVFLVFLTSRLHFLITKPCEGMRIRGRCDYDYGFPFPYWFFSDVVDAFSFFSGILLFFIDVAFWVILLTFLFELLRRTRRNKIPTRG